MTTETSERNTEAYSEFNEGYEKAASKPTEITAAEFMENDYGAKNCREIDKFGNFIIDVRPLAKPYCDFDLQIIHAGGSYHDYNDAKLTVEWLPEAAQSSEPQESFKVGDIVELKDDQPLFNNSNAVKLRAGTRGKIIAKNNNRWDVEWLTTYPKIGVMIVAEELIMKVASEPAPVAESAGDVGAKQIFPIGFENDEEKVLYSPPSQQPVPVMTVGKDATNKLFINRVEAKRCELNGINEDGDYTFELAYEMIINEDYRAELTAVRSELATAQAEAGKLRAALEFYADKNNYIETWNSKGDNSWIDAVLDNGAIARKALADSK